MDYQIEIRFKKLKAQIEEQFGGGMDTESILFLVGVQELGQGYKKFSKDEKINLLHIALCTVLAPYGYYEYKGLDVDGWPHYEALKKLPTLSNSQQQHLIKEGLLEYFKEVYDVSLNNNVV